MPLLDVTDILGDPDIAGEAITIVRARRSVNQQGMTVDSPYTIVTYGCLQPAQGHTLDQFPEEQRVGSWISVTVPVPLIPLSRSNAPDLIVSNGQYYRVISVNDYANFGSGVWEGVCRLMDTVLELTA